MGFELGPGLLGKPVVGLGVVVLALLVHARVAVVEQEQLLKNDLDCGSNVTETRAGFWADVGLRLARSPELGGHCVGISLGLHATKPLAEQRCLPRGVHAAIDRWTADGEETVSCLCR